MARTADNRQGGRKPWYLILLLYKKIEKTQLNRLLI
jgi:hypothetical protein